MSSALNLQGLAKAYGATQALAGVDVDLAVGEVHALLGANGSGKSTLVKILAGVTTADSGEIQTRSGLFEAAQMDVSKAWDLGLRFVHQDPAVFPELTVYENLALGRPMPTRAGAVNRRRLREEAARLIDRFDLHCHPDDHLGRLRPAQRTMVAIARALQDEDDHGTSGHILILDEPTASLSGIESEHLLTSVRSLADRGSTILYITHRLQELDGLVDRVTVLRDGHVVMAGPHQGHDRGRLIEAIAGRPLDLLYPHRGAQPTGDVVLDVQALCTRRLHGVTLQARAGEIVGIAGFLGAGRSHLLKAVFGAEQRQGSVHVLDREVPPGSIRAAARAGLSLVPEDRAGSGAFLDLPISENVVAGASRTFRRLGRVDARRQGAEVDRVIGEHRVKARHRGQLVAQLSGGNQQKVVLARWMRRDPHVLLLDEPTQGVDAGARQDIYLSIRTRVDHGATALVVSSDFEELANLCDRVLVLVDGQVVDSISASELTAAELTRRCLQIPEGLKS